MQLSRRSLGVLAATSSLAPGLAAAQGTDPRLSQRAVGSADAPVTVTEFFSLTCGHCAAFHNTNWARVKTELVDAGRIRFVWRDFPLDGIALAAACVARALPEERYGAFIGTLFQTQDRWAFVQGRQMEELARMAALAGMDRKGLRRRRRRRGPAPWDPGAAPGRRARLPHLGHAELFLQRPDAVGQHAPSISSSSWCSKRLELDGNRTGPLCHVDGR